MAPGGCATCHGDTGAGLPRLGPDIQHPTRDLFDFLVRNGEAHQVTAYAAPMPAFADTLVSSGDLDSIFAWLRAMPQPTTGGALFADYCSYCHGSDGRGGAVGVAYASAYHSAPFRRKGVEFRDYVRKGHVVDDKGALVPVSERHAYMPAFGPELLSDAELTLIENWLPK
jgi:mono/diheme cytochrome c family protein